MRITKHYLLIAKLVWPAQGSGSAMLKRARQHQIVERIFGSFPPSSFPSNLPLPSSSSFSFSNKPSLFPIPFFFSPSRLHSPVPYLFPWLVGPAFSTCTLSVWSKGSFSRSLHVFSGLSVFFSLPPSCRGAPFVRRCSSFLFPLLFLLALYYATLPAGSFYPLSLSRALLGEYCRAPARETARRCRRVDERFVGARGRDQTRRPLPPSPHPRHGSAGP